MNFKQRSLYLLLDGRMGDKTLLLSIQYQNICNVTYFFYILCMEAHAYGLYKI